MDFSLFDYVLLAMGLYVLYAGISGKGKLYAVDNLKEGKEELFKKTMRKLYLALGIVMTINGLASVAKYAFYSYEEVTAAAGDTAAVYDWVAKQDLGAFRFLTVNFLNIITYVCLGLCMAAIVAMIIFLRKVTDKNAAPKSQAGQSAGAANQAGHVLPVSAFDFDEPEEKPAEESTETTDKQD